MPTGFGWPRKQSQGAPSGAHCGLETRETNATFFRAGLCSAALSTQDSIGIGAGLKRKCRKGRLEHFNGRLAQVGRPARGAPHHGVVSVVFGWRRLGWASSACCADRERGTHIQGSLAPRGGPRATRYGGVAPGVFNGALGMKGEP